MNPKHFTVTAGPHTRRNTPVSFDLGAAAAVGRLTRKDSAKQLPCQVVDGVLHFVLDELAANTDCPLIFEPTDSDDELGVKLKHRESEGELEVEIGAAPFTTYHYANVPFRPYLHPFLGPGGVQITRNYPMMKGVDGETEDHEHHRSVWVAFGELNGSDNWAEQEVSGFQVHRRIVRMLDGPVLGQFEHEIEWRDNRKEAVLTETRRLCFYQSPAHARIMDMSVVFTASRGQVVFGDTKEGGICSVRVATTMDESRGGRIENSAGGLGEAETWGKPAHWCDYSGPCQGKHVGIAIFDHPMNLRHPTCWHVRSYGLMTANPFGYGDYKSSLLTDGSYVLEAGRSLTFNYRLFVHEGNAAAANLQDRYHDYIHPPQVVPAE